MDKKPASKETIESLIDNAGKAIQDLYVSIRKDIADKSVISAIQPSIFLRTEDVRIGVQFVIMDLGVSCRALFVCNNPFEKRHHMKNLYASISEGYKLLLGFGKTRKYTLWSLLQEEVKKIGDGNLTSECVEITSRLDGFASKCIDQDLRNLTLHYDENMMRVFEKTASLNNEDTTVQCVCELWAIFQDILLFCNKVDEYEEHSTHIMKPVSTEPVRLDVNRLHDCVRILIGSNGRLADVISEIISKASKQLDGMADNVRKLQRVQCFVQKQAIVEAPFPEFDIIEALANCEMLVRFMAIDLASILNSYLHSATDIESSLNLRRVVVIKTSTLVHLYGYNEEEYGKSVWKSIKSFIPDNNKVLLEESTDIEGVLRIIVSNDIDKELRVSLVHLYNNNDNKADVENVISTVESLNPINHITEILLLMHLYKRIQSFTLRLMDILANKAHRQALESQKQVEEMMASILEKLESSQVPSELKVSFSESINKIKSLLA